MWLTEASEKPACKQEFTHVLCSDDAVAVSDPRSPLTAVPLHREESQCFVAIEVRISTYSAVTIPTREWDVHHCLKVRHVGMMLWVARIFSFGIVIVNLFLKATVHVRE